MDPLTHIVVGRALVAAASRHGGPQPFALGAAADPRRAVTRHRQRRCVRGLGSIPARSSVRAPTRSPARWSWRPAPRRWSGCVPGSPAGPPCSPRRLRRDQPCRAGSRVRRADRRRLAAVRSAGVVALRGNGRSVDHRVLRRRPARAAAGTITDAYGGPAGCDQRLAVSHLQSRDVGHGACPDRARTGHANGGRGAMEFLERSGPSTGEARASSALSRSAVPAYPQSRSWRRQSNQTRRSWHRRASSTRYAIFSRRTSLRFRSWRLTAAITFPCCGPICATALRRPQQGPNLVHAVRHLGGRYFRSRRSCS